MVELTEKTFNFATYAQYHFKYGDLQVKKEILMALGQNPIVKDGKVMIPLNKWLQPIENEYKSLETEFLTVRNKEKIDIQNRSEAMQSLFVRWSG